MWHIVSHPERDIIIHEFVGLQWDHCNALYTCPYKIFLEWLEAVQKCYRQVFKSNKIPQVFTGDFNLDATTFASSCRLQFKIISSPWWGLRGATRVYQRPIALIHVPGWALKSYDQCLLMVPHTKMKTDYAVQWGPGSKILILWAWDWWTLCCVMNFLFCKHFAILCFERFHIEKKFHLLAGTEPQSDQTAPVSDYSMASKGFYRRH